MNTNGAEAREAMAIYCRAQANIMKLAKEHSDLHSELAERVRTTRSVLVEELLSHNITCMEFTPLHHTEPVYFRIRYTSKKLDIDSELVLKILRFTDPDDFASVAEKNGHDIPKMLAALVSSYVKKHTVSNNEKPTLSVSKTKERGYARNHAVTPHLLKLAQELHDAREELSKLKELEKQKKMCHVEEQRLVEDEVKTLLKERDPTNKTAKVHMTQDGSEWVYYLRCKEEEKVPSIGVRRAVPLVEEAIYTTLQSLGMGREYSTRFLPSASFWEELQTCLCTKFEEVRGNTKLVSTLKLDRGAPRKRKGGPSSPASSSYA